MMASLSDVASDERTASMVLSMLVDPNDPVTGRILSRLGAVETLWLQGTTVTGADFMHDLNASNGSELRIGSLFSGYGSLDLAVEHVFNARTVWFSELNEPVARVFSRHWPGAPNLGDITTIDWRRVEPVDILIGGLPLSALLTNASASSPSPGALFRTPLATDSSRGGETLDQVRARRGTIALSQRIIGFALHGPAGSPSRRDESETLWSLIDGLFNAGDATPMPSPAGSTSPEASRQRQHS